jgi:hypothetical protein
LQRFVFVGFLFLALVGAVPVSASSQAPLQTSIDPAASEPTVADNLLFVELSGPGGVDQVLDASYAVNGEVVFSERITFHEPAQPEVTQREEGPAALELLAWHPEVRQYLLERATLGERVTATLYPQDNSARTQSIGGLLQRSHELQRLGLRPAANQSTVLSPSAITLDDEAQDVQRPSLSRKSACEDQCQYQLWTCESDCGGDPQCEYWCGQQYQYCMEDCQGCTGPSIQEWEESQVISYVYLGPSVCYGQPGFSGVVSDYSYLKIKYTTYRKTTYCDGSSTTEVIGIRYYDQNCWLWNGFCPQATGYVSPICPI